MTRGERGHEVWGSALWQKHISLDSDRQYLQDGSNQMNGEKYEGGISGKTPLDFADYRINCFLYSFLIMFSSSLAYISLD